MMMCSLPLKNQENLSKEARPPLTHKSYRSHRSLGYLTTNEFLKTWYDSSAGGAEVSTMS